MLWGRKWPPTPVFLPGESPGQRSLVGCRLWGRIESDTTEAMQQQQHSEENVCNSGSFINIRVMTPHKQLMWVHVHIPEFGLSWHLPGSLTWHSFKEEKL